MRILHASESLATGVFDVVRRLARQQSELGHEVTIVHTPRRESPSLDSMQRQLPGIQIREVGDSSMNAVRRLGRLFSAINSLMREGDFDVLHLHSTYAGAVGRLTPRKSTRVYSPHGFSFLRRDVSRWRAMAFLGVEWCLAKTGDYIICVSHDEAITAKVHLGAPVVVLPNVLDLQDPMAPRHSAGSERRSRPVVVNVGRWCEQKAPERFVDAARKLAGIADFVWIGSAPEGADVGNVEVTGWLQQDEVWKRLASASIVYFTSRWEGMPVGLMQAQAAGVPAVALACIGVRDVVVDGVTGVIVEHAASGPDVLENLLLDAERRRHMSISAWESRERFSSDGYGERSIAVYNEAREARGSRSQRAQRRRGASRRPQKEA